MLYPSKNYTKNLQEKESQKLVVDHHILTVIILHLWFYGIILKGVLIEMSWGYVGYGYGFYSWWMMQLQSCGEKTEASSTK
jgi:hypothetical protein